MRKKSLREDDPAFNSIEIDDTIVEEELYDEMDEENDNLPLLGRKNQKEMIRLEPQQHKYRHSEYLNTQQQQDSPHLIEARSRSRILALSLFLNLGTFWLLDSLKDPLFAILLGDNAGTDNSNFEKNQPLAKMFSVLSTLVLVFILEVFMNQSPSKLKDSTTEKGESRIDETSEWETMNMATTEESIRQATELNNDEGSVPAMSMISHVQIPYSILFFIFAVLIRQYAPFDESSSTTESNADFDVEVANHTVEAYIIYVAIESFGSLSVAAFWSYSNSNLDIEGAKKNYGLIIAIAQIGAILGSTIVALEVMSIPHLLLLSSALMVFNMMLMTQYHIWYPNPMDSLDQSYHGDGFQHVSSYKSNTSRKRLKKVAKILGPDKEHINKASLKNEQSRLPPSKKKSGLFLIFQHNYLLSILAVSCLYEISLTCIDYEMKLVGLKRFDLSEENSTLNFKQFMGHFGQLTNVLSFILSFFGFPMLMEHYGVRSTLRIFPGFLVLTTVFTFTILPNNLWLLFVSMATLKSMTYSINEPAKEILYMPTSSTVKVKAKFWIDVVGGRFAKALGSSITNYAGSADRIVKVGGVPSVLSSLIFLYFCIKVGEEFEDLVNRGKIVGNDDDDDGDDFDGSGSYNLISRFEYGEETADEYLMSMDPFTYKPRGNWQSDHEGHVYDDNSSRTRNSLRTRHSDDEYYSPPARSGRNRQMGKTTIELSQEIEDIELVQGPERK